MRSCWLPNPDDRPTFIQLVAMLKDLHFIDEENSAKEKVRIIAYYYYTPG